MALPTTVRRRAFAFRRASSGLPSFEILLTDCTPTLAVGRYRVQGDKQWMLWAAELHFEGRLLSFGVQGARRLREGRRHWMDVHPVVPVINRTIKKLVQYHCPSPIRDRIFDDY